MLNPFKSTRRARRGNVVVLAAISLVMIVGFLAFSVDFGYIVVAESNLQNAADAGALSGARALVNGREAAVAAAKTWAAKNFVAGHPVLIDDDDVIIGFWDKQEASFTPLAPDSTRQPNAVQVTCQRTNTNGNPLRLFFAPVLGVSGADLEVTAIALHRGGSCGGILALNRVYLREDSYTDSFNSSVADYYTGAPGDNGDVCTNGHVRLIGNAGINGDAHPGPEEDGVDMGDSNYVTGEIEVLEERIEFPPVRVGNIAVVNDNANLPRSSNGVQLDDAALLQLSGNDALDMPPGNYYLTGLELQDNSIIRVTGPTTIYIAGDVDLSDGGIINQTLRPMNLQIYSLGDSFWLPENTDLYAVIYSTTSAIEKAGGSGGFFGKMVGQKIKINGSGGLHVDDSVVLGDLVSGGEQLGVSAGASIVD